MRELRWWCGPGSGAWDWTWQPYVGVWLFLLAIIGAYILLLRRIGRPEPGERRARRRAVGWFATGIILLWGALDWPLGPLGAGYLASLHMVQFLLVGVAAPAFLLLGLPPETFRRIERAPRFMKLLDDLTQPIAAFFIFNVVMTVTHWPSVVDTLMATAAGSFVVDITWLLTGLVFWWPLRSPVPARPRFGPMLQVVYLALNAVLVRPPFAFLLFSRYPVYAKYELAAPILGTDALGDQQLAAGIMKMGTAWIMAVAAAVIIYQYHRRKGLA